MGCFSAAPLTDTSKCSIISFFKKFDYIPYTVLFTTVTYFIIVSLCLLFLSPILPIHHPTPFGNHQFVLCIYESISVLIWFANISFLHFCSSGILVCNLLFCVCFCLVLVSGWCWPCRMNLETFLPLQFFGMV